jgi:hypothetical protein
MTKRNAIAVLAVVLGAVACERAASPASSAASDTRTAPTAPRDYSSTGSLTTASGSPAIAVASVRRYTSGLYVARAVATTSNVHLSVRSSTTGFSSITSGTLVQEDESTSPLEFQFSTSSGNRYLIVATPVQGGVGDESRASFVEIVL